jgi:hypothetical protein
MKVIMKIKCEMQLKRSRYLDEVSLEEWHKPVCPLTVDDTEGRSKIGGSFDIQLDESPDGCDIPVIFLFLWPSTMGKLRTEWYKQYCWT